MKPAEKIQNIGWCLTAKEKDMSFSYRWTIEDFKSKMETFKLGQQLESSQFTINGFKLCINLYPNGRNEEEGGYVSLFLRNDNSFQLEVMCDFILGVSNSFKHSFGYNKVNPNSGYGFPKMYAHEQILSKNILDEEKLEIEAVITFKGKVKNINMNLEETKAQEVPNTAKVGDDLFKFFESQEFCDFDIVCDDKVIKCHKVVLASRSPVFKAMLLHNMEESNLQKVEPKNFDFDTMNHVLKFMYKGEIENALLEKHASTIFKAADYYEINDLKKACEKVLIKQITIRNMVDMLVMSDMYKAPDLKAATKKLIVHNSRELMKQRDWKQKFGGSSHLVFEILESVITKDDAP